MIKIATSILSSKDRKECIEKLNITNTEYIHIDVMDNIFVPNYQLPIEEVNELGKYSDKPFDVHLMVEDPESFIKNITIDNVQSITIHLEIDKDIFNLINLIKKYDYQVGMAIKPNTDINKIDKYINLIDKVIVMSVEPGFGGQKFIDSSVDRVKSIRNKRKDITIEVDGGINNETIKKINNYADIAVVGSYITNNSDFQEAINNLKN